MGIGLMGAICEMAWKQGDDLYGYDDNRFLAGCEYVAKYNLGEDVPFQAVVVNKKHYTAVSPLARGDIRPVWALVYNHYVKRKGLAAPYTTRMMQQVAHRRRRRRLRPQQRRLRSTRLRHADLHLAVVRPSELSETATALDSRIAAGR